MRIVVGCSQGKALGKILAKRLRCSYSDLTTEKFPDGETKIRLECRVSGNEIFIVQPLHPNPNDSLVELLFALNTARELGAKKVFAVVPYFAYARQDTRFNQGEVVSNKIVARMVEEAGADAFVTVTTHLHRISSLHEIFKHIAAKNVLLSKEIAEYAISKKLRTQLVVGPDWESGPIARDIAMRIGADSYVFRKKRFSGTRIKNFQNPGLVCAGKNVLLVDDMASTGNTLISVARILKKNGAKRVDCAVVHLLDEAGGMKVLKGGLDSMACSNSIPNKFSKIDCSKQIASALERL